MSILKIKDSSGNWKDIPALRGQTGPQGIQGPAGQDGVGIPSGGTQGQVLSKVDGTDYNTEWVNLPNPDLSNYYTKSEVDTAIANAITDTLGGEY